MPPFEVRASLSNTFNQDDLKKIRLAITENIKLYPFYFMFSELEDLIDDAKCRANGAATEQVINIISNDQDTNCTDANALLMFLTDTIETRNNNQLTTNNQLATNRKLFF